MNAKTIIPLVLGVGVGGIALKTVVDVVNQAKGATQANITQCVVAKTDIEFAEEVSPTKLVVRDWPKDMLPPQYFSSIEELRDRVSSSHIPKDVPIYPSMLAPPGTPAGLQTRIKPGYRAVSVAIDEVSGVAYQLRPGDFVDVLSLVRRHKANGGQEMVSSVILQNVEIAAVGRALSSDRPGESAKTVARSVTLLLKPDQITKLHLAQSNQGKISLALRGNEDDAEHEDLPATTLSGLLGKEETTPTPVLQHTLEEPVKEFQPEPQARQWKVKVVSGNEIRLISYEQMEQGDWVEVGSEPGDLHTPPAGSILQPGQEDDFRED